MNITQKNSFIVTSYAASKAIIDDIKKKHKSLPNVTCKGSFCDSDPVRMTVVRPVGHPLGSALVIEKA